MKLTSLVVEPIANYHCRCGENPLWDDRLQRFYWVDIPAGRLFEFNPTDNSHRIALDCHPQPIGGFTFQDTGELLLFRDNDIARFNPTTGQCTSIIPFHDEGVPRFNDVMACPDGTVLAGTMGKNLRGGLYHLTTDGQITNLLRGTNCANGMAFTHAPGSQTDQRTLYWTDTTAKKIHAFDFDPRNSELTNRRVLIDVTQLPGAGVPDGMTIDTAGRLYSTRWGGYGIYVYDRDGSPLGKIDLSVERISSCIFGGPDMTDLYVTTAGGNAPGGGIDGTLYRIRGLDAQGLPEYRSRITV